MWPLFPLSFSFSFVRFMVFMVCLCYRGFFPDAFFIFVLLWIVIIATRVHLATFMKVNLSSLTSPRLCMYMSVMNGTIHTRFSIFRRLAFELAFLLIFLFGYYLEKMCFNATAIRLPLKLEDGNKIYLLNTQINLHKK